mgnify:CR=1 FL=1
MDKRICKYETSNVLKYALLYYGALLIFFILAVITTKGTSLEINEEVNFVTMIFLASQPLLRFKGDFYFSKINNISRKNFIKRDFNIFNIISYRYYFNKNIFTFF